MWQWRWWWWRYGDDDDDDDDDKLTHIVMKINMMHVDDDEKVTWRVMKINILHVANVLQVLFYHLTHYRTHSSNWSPICTQSHLSPTVTAWYWFSCLLVQNVRSYKRQTLLTFVYLHWHLVQTVKVLWKAVMRHHWCADRRHCCIRNQTANCTPDTGVTSATYNDRRRKGRKAGRTSKRPRGPLGSAWPFARWNQDRFMANGNVAEVTYSKRCLNLPDRQKY